MRRGKQAMASGIEDYHKSHGVKRSRLIDSALLPSEIVFHWGVPGPVMMARREAYSLLGGYDESLRLEDWDFYLRLASQNALGYVNTPVSSWRVHGNNTILRKDNYLDGALEATMAKNWQRFTKHNRLRLWGAVATFAGKAFAG